ncbi:solute carrier organic anion transporter family member 74D-like isoform X2 [Rhodnius prolixus]
MEKTNNRASEDLQIISEQNANELLVSSHENDLQLDFDENSLKCGFWGYNPKWLQRLASKKIYVLIYGLLGVYETVLESYFIGTISTLEKRFRFPSATSGMITSAWDVGTMFASLIVAYFGNTGHKTRWVACGIIMGSISCFLRYTPHLLYGPGEEAVLISTPNASSPGDNLCKVSDMSEENCAFNSESTVSFVILLISLLMLGAGTSPYYTLGMAYLDDNALKNKFPFLFSIVLSLRYLGPTLGFMVSSYALSIYVEPEINPPFGEDDPRWIGAWYLGWNPLGIFGILMAFLMALFPKILPREAERRKNTGVTKKSNKTKSFKDFMETMARLLKNRVFMYNTFSTTLAMLGILGFWIFMPKYIETQFRKTASEANLITGTIGLLSTAAGIISSGALISKFKPRPTYLAAWNVITEIFDVLTQLTFAFLGCYKTDFHGALNDDSSWNLITECNMECNCDPSMKYKPVCSLDQTMTYYSPCHAGCTDWSLENGTKVYENCSCIGDGFGKALEGACPLECQTDYVLFLVMLCLMEFFSSTGRSGNTIIQFRAVLPEDKSVSIAVTAVVLCAFAFIPGPILHGTLVDLSCVVWGMTCGETGNCWLYDGQKMRYLLNFTAV